MPQYTYKCRCTTPPQRVTLIRFADSRDNLPECKGCGKLMLREVAAHAKIKNYGGDD